LVWVIIVLASLNIAADICFGGLIYYQLGRWKVPGFADRPVACAPPRVEIGENRPHNEIT
jgi:hypothetical protein